MAGAKYNNQTQLTGRKEPLRLNCQIRRSGAVADSPSGSNLAIAFLEERLNLRY